ncbi:hypothetical protein [Planctomicrobium piriforme]|uniref:Uncharacterized protein n=1 Tax=Planctomicrobium piriforme TaxID=1576369 RepID=A0A1I3BML5_9PLAN|nr:hypothetical protein [Planctomicrobium piriforme]SFH63346.1 hypothetical protein SAMN05421753_101531 [Planctomicrobium piriforme]
MEAIAELFAAIMQALIGLFVALIELCFTTIDALFSLVFGWEPRNKQQKANTDAPAQPGAAEEVQKTTSVQSSQIWSASLIIVPAIVIWIVGSIVYSEIQSAREKAAKQLVKSTASEVITSLGQGEDPPVGPMKVTDPWGQPLELFLDKTLVGTLVVVRSSGRDRKPGTIDDILEITGHGNSVDKIADQLGDKAARIMGEKLKNLFDK